MSNWTVPTEALTCAKDARHALLNVCVTEDARIVIRGKAGDNDPLFASGDPIMVGGLPFWDAMKKITSWFERGREITRIELINFP
jgi:hypothetical protein